MQLLPHIERILDAAIRAPSRDNSQPWRFVVDGETISFLVDHERDRSPLNAGNRMARIAIGAAVECVLLRAGRMGASVKMEAPRPNALVTMTITSPKRSPEADKALVRRATNQRLYDARPLDDETLAFLRDASPVIDGVRTLWFGRERARTLGPVVEQAETLLFSDARLRDAALRAVRFDVRDRDEVLHGVSLGSLELSAQERVTFDALRRTSHEPLAATGAAKKLGERARRLVESASAVCLFTAKGSEPDTDVSVGRAMQRAWLALTRRGLVAQPLSTIPAMEAMLETGECNPAASESLAAMVATLRAAFPGVDRESRIALVMRVGSALPPTSRSGRRPIEDSVVGPASPEDAARAAAARE